MTGLHWTRRVRSILSSLADVAGDWFYYRYVTQIDEARLEAPKAVVTTVLVTCTVSSVLGLLTIYANCCCRGGSSSSSQQQKNCCFCLPSTKFWHLVETVFEDIPQVILSSYIAYQLRGDWSPQAIFNLTTSGFNFMLDFLDIFEPIDSSSSSDEENGEEASFRDDNSTTRSRRHASVY